MPNIKNYKYIVLTPLFALVLALFSIFIYQFDNYMFGWEAKRRWGNESYSADHFRKAKTNERSAFVADILGDDYFYGKPSEIVVSELGPPDGGYYNYDSNLSYEIHNDGHTMWDLVFIVSHENGTVESILIHKRCCSVTRKIIGWLFK